MVTTLTLADFMHARFDEDEHAARDTLAMLGEDSWLHAVGYDPNRAIADCQAKRRLVTDWQTFQRGHDEQAEDLPLPQRLTMAGIAKGYEVAVKTLAAPYADHPDYRPEWRP